MEMYFQLNIEDTSGQAVLPSPGRGYYTNWNIIMMTAAEIDGKEGVFNIGYKPYKAELSGDSVAYTNKGEITFNYEFSTSRINRFFSKKKVYVDYDTTLVINAVQPTLDINVYLQATFVPEKNSIVRVRRKYDLATYEISMDHQIVVPFNGKLIAIKSDLVVTEAATAGGGVADYRVIHLDNHKTTTPVQVSNSLGDILLQENTNNLTVGDLKYGRESLANHKFASEQNVARTYSWFDQCNKDVAKLDGIVPFQALITGNAPDVVLLELELYFQYLGVNDREILEEYYLYEDSAFTDWGLIEALEDVTQL